MTHPAALGELRRQFAHVRVAVAHDWLTGMRGGEKTLEALCELFPNLTLFTMLHVKGSVSPALEHLRPRTSFVQAMPGLARFYRYALPLFPLAVEQFDLRNFDLVVSTSHCATKSVIAPPQVPHVCYCFTPMRYAWDQFDAYFGEARLGFRSRLARIALSRLAAWDLGTADRPNRYVAISQYVANRISRYYNRRSVVVYPPVDTTFYHPDGSAPDPFFLVVSALVPYKRIEVAIDACRQVGVPLKVIGKGPERARLERLAGPGTEFLGPLPDAEVRGWYRRAAAVLLPGEEDFGIVPVEAQACGRPVVALGKGGAVETVIDGVTGVLVEEATAEAFAEGLRAVRRLAIDPRAVRAHAERFARERFQAQMAELLLNALATHEEGARV